MKKYFFLSLVFAALCFTGCKKCPENKTLFVDTDSLENHIIADTIVYDVIIKNSASSADWMNQCQQYSELSHLKKNAFVDSLFAGVYGRRYKIFDLFTGVEISPEELANIEKEDGFSRDAIGKIQFTETWYYDEQIRIFRKKVISMILGVEQIDANGTLKGYKAIFKIYMN